MRGITNIVIMTGSPFERKDLEWACYRLFPDADRECFLDVQSGLDYMLIRQGKDVKEHARRWLVLADAAMPVIPDLGEDDKAGEYVLKQMRKYLGGNQAGDVAVILVGDGLEGSAPSGLYPGCPGYLAYSPFSKPDDAIVDLMDRLGN